MKENKLKTIHEIVYSFSTSHTSGFTNSELEEVFSGFPGANREKFDNALLGVTGMIHDDGSFLIYHDDVELALRCALENRNPTSFEFD